MPQDKPISAERYRPFVYVFVPFSLILAAGNIFYSELSPGMFWGQFFYPDAEAHLPSATTNMTLGRVVVSILISFLFAIPALILFALYDLRTAPPAIYRYWQLFWSFSFLAYTFHAYFATVAWFGWDFTQIAQRQTWPILLVNYTLLLAWGVDVYVSLSKGQGGGGRWFYRFQWVTHLLFAAAAVAAAVVFAMKKDTTSPSRSLESLILGWTMALSFGSCLIARIAFGPVKRDSDPGP